MEQEIYDYSQDITEYGYYLSQDNTLNSIKYNISVIYRVPLDRLEPSTISINDGSTIYFDKKTGRVFIYNRGFDGQYREVSRRNTID